MALVFSSRFYWQAIFGIVFIFHFHSFSQNDDISKLVLEPQLESKGKFFYFEDKLYTGPVVKLHSNKKKAETYSLKNGKLHGLWKEWNLKGQMTNQANYRNGKLHGVFIQFRPDGSREFEVNYIDGLESGSFKRWFKNGKLWVDENYFAGKLNGISKIFYLDGKVQVQSGYQAGKKNGLENAWYDNGQLRWQVVYENGIIKNKLRWKRDGSPSNQDPPKIF